MALSYLLHVCITDRFRQTDILKSKLENGVMVSKYVRSYGNRPNEYEAVSKCLSFLAFDAHSLTLFPAVH